MNTAEIIKDQIAAHFDICVSDLTGPNRKQSVYRPRRLGYYLCRQMADMTFSDIGRAFGGRDHSTVQSGLEAFVMEPNARANMETIRARVAAQLTPVGAFKSVRTQRTTTVGSKP